ncbi:MAG TPA: dihydroorotase family protein, partial [Thermoleophilia bacterium]|nr:dihydroorotase family protein [Thermoleophilia bacterium]
ADLQALWRAIAEREIEMVVATDHAPHPKKDKAVGAENVWSSPPGFPGVQTMLPLMLNEVSAGVLSLNRLVELCSETPARVFGIFPRKGALAIGSDADMTIVDMHREAIIRSSDQHTKAGFTPFDGWKVKGQPVMTIVTGKVVMENGKLVEDGPRGKFVAGRMLAR